jgi:branched-chain amino acid transport system substrate-binding protein
MSITVAIGAASLILTGCVSSDSETAEESAVAEVSEEATAAESAAESEAEATGDPLVLGIVQAGSGFMGPIDTPARNALLLEVEKVNAAGGVNGAPITVEFIDTETKFERYASAAEEVIGKGANVLVVTCDYDVSAPAALVAEAKNILNIAPCIGDPIYGPAGGLNLGFSMGAGTPGESSIMPSSQLRRVGRPLCCSRTPRSSTRRTSARSSTPASPSWVARFWTPTPTSRVTPSRRPCRRSRRASSPT